MKPEKLTVEISHAMPARLEYLARRAAITAMSDRDRAAVNRAIADRRAHFGSPEFLAKLARTL